MKMPKVIDVFDPVTKFEELEKGHLGSMYGYEIWVKPPEGKEIDVKTVCAISTTLVGPQPEDPYTPLEQRPTAKQIVEQLEAATEKLNL